MHVKSMHTCRKCSTDAMDGKLEIADDRIVGERYRMIFKRVIVSHWNKSGQSGLIVGCCSISMIA